jgi:hypothetical protein
LNVLIIMSVMTMRLRAKLKGSPMEKKIFELGGNDDAMDHFAALVMGVVYKDHEDEIDEMLKKSMDDGDGGNDGGFAMMNQLMMWACEVGPRCEEFMHSQAGMWKKETAKK